MGYEILNLSARASPFGKSDTIEASDKPWQCRLQQEIWKKFDEEIEILGQFATHLIQFCWN